jgi:hypothetical protein
MLCSHINERRRREIIEPILRRAYAKPEGWVSIEYRVSPSGAAQEEYSMIKRIVRSAIKVVAVIAAGVFVVVPPGNQLLLFIGSMAVLLLCLLLWLLLFGDENTGWWPDNPEQ